MIINNKDYDTNSTSLMLITTGSKVDNFYLCLILWFYQDVLLKSTAQKSIF